MGAIVTVFHCIAYLSHSLKSALVFSQPFGVSSLAATLSASCIFQVLALSVQSSYIMLRLTSSV